VEIKEGPEKWKKTTLHELAQLKGKNKPLNFSLPKQGKKKGKKTGHEEDSI